MLPRRDAATPCHVGFSNWPRDPQLSEDRIDAVRGRVVLCDGGVYDNHGVEPIIKSYLTNFGGVVAPVTGSASLHIDWLSRLRRLVDVTDNQMRAPRRRDLAERFEVANRGRDLAQLTGDARMGAYCGIDAGPRKSSRPMGCPAIRR